MCHVNMASFRNNQNSFSVLPCQGLKCYSICECVCECERDCVKMAASQELLLSISRLLCHSTNTLAEIAKKDTTKSKIQPTRYNTRYFHVMWFTWHKTKAQKWRKKEIQMSHIVQLRNKRKRSSVWLWMCATMWRVAISNEFGDSRLYFWSRTANFHTLPLTGLRDIVISLLLLRSLAFTPSIPFDSFLLFVLRHSFVIYCCTLSRFESVSK